MEVLHYVNCDLEAVVFIILFKMARTFKIDLYKNSTKQKNSKVIFFSKKAF